MFALSKPKLNKRNGRAILIATVPGAGTLLLTGRGVRQLARLVSHAGTVKLTIKGVEAKVLLKVRLDNVARIIDRVFDTIDNNPEIIPVLAGQVGQAVAELDADTGDVVDVVATGESPASAAGGERRSVFQARWDAL